MDEKSKLCYLQGIGLNYYDFTGKYQVVDQEIRDQLLLACGHQLAKHAIAKSNETLDALPWLNVLPNIQTTVENDAKIKVRIADNLLNQTIRWQLLDEHNQLVATDQCIGEILAESGHYFYQGMRYSERLIELGKLSPGYYQFLIHFSEQTIASQVVCSPTSCFNNISDDKLWGVSVQLYSIKSSDNFGIGDFNDLRELISLSAQQGADYILLNPLHKLFQQTPERASPYSPSDRTQLNPLYISPNLSEDFLADNFNLETSESYIDYQAVSSEKYAIFTEMFAVFSTKHLSKDTVRAKAFAVFKDQHKLWKLTNFDYYLQWQAWLQLEQCQQYCLQLKMKVGLMLDLAVGCAPDGEEYQRNQQLFSKNASIGAPPDPIALQGQNWGLPAPDPVKLKNNNFQFFIDLLRANMQACGALRIDHVMGLMRLWWCVQYKEQQHGCYVYYPFEELLAILALESHRNNCLVIGEDLGVVPPEVIANMTKKQLYGNDIFYFEKNASGQFKAIDEFRQQAILMIANHDVPPFYAWWQADDIHTKHEFNLLNSNEEVSQALTDREQDKALLLQWLGWANSPQPSEKVYHAVAGKLANSPSTLFCLQVEDLEGVNTPVNIPGTDAEYPNWCRSLSQPLTKIFDQSALFASINQGRRNAKARSNKI